MSAHRHHGVSLYADYSACYSTRTEIGWLTLGFPAGEAEVMLARELLSERDLLATPAKPAGDSGLATAALKSASAW